MSIKKEPNAIDRKVGDRVRLARKLKGMSQGKLAHVLGLTYQQVQKYEKGINRIGSSRLQQISTILGRPVSWFFGEADGPTEQTDLITKMLTTPHGLDLAKSFLAVRHNAERATIAQVAQTIAAAGGA